ncbi:TPA: hypothetical protein ACGBG5_003532 [Enterococcus faecalis]
MNKSEFNLLELAVIHTSLTCYLEKLQATSIDENDVKIRGEIECTKSAIKKVIEQFVDITGDPTLLK